MKLLAIDTTTKFLCLGAFEDQALYEYNLELGPRQSALLVPAIQRVITALGWQVRDIDYFACGIGPGSFTGTRVGLSVIKGLAWSQNKPVVGVPTLDALARNARDLNSEFIIPTVDAKRSLIYCSIYRKHQDTIKRITPYMLLGIDELIRKISRMVVGKKQAVVFGDAAALYKEKMLLSGVNLRIMEKDYWYPRVHNIIGLAEGLIKSGKVGNALNIKPIYLYPKECQVRNVKMMGL